MSELKHKAFIAALYLINSESKKAKQFLSDKRLTFQERTLISCFLALRDFENQEVINILEKMNCPDPLVESQKNYCIGAAYNNLTKFKESASYLMLSIEGNHFQGGEILKLGAMGLLFTVFLNTNDIGGMEHVLNSMKSIKKQDKTTILHFKSCEFSLAVQKQEFIKAQKMIDYLEIHFEEMNEHKRMAYLYDLFELHLFKDDFISAQKALDRIKLFKKYKNPVHTKYMQNVLRFLQHGTPLYLYEREFSEYPLLLNQLLCLQGLERGDEELSLKAWNNLRQLDPQSTKTPYDYSGPANLFSRALKVLNPKVNEKVIVDAEFKPGMLKEEKLFYLLNHSQSPLPKELIYTKLWNEKINSKDDLVKLAKVVQRTKQRYSVEIKSIKGAYIIVNKKTA